MINKYSSTLSYNVANNINIRSIYIKIMKCQLASKVHGVLEF